jgi:hypothetical protein
MIACGNNTKYNQTLNIILRVVTDELVEFEEKPIEVQDSRSIIDHLSLYSLIWEFFGILR